MNTSTVISIFLLIITFNGIADSKEDDRLSSGNGKLRSICEIYRGSICSKYIKNGTIYVEPLKPQRHMETKLQTAFRLFPKFLSIQCSRYAFPALCIYAFPPCDETVSYPKRRPYCRDECEALQQHICAHEFSIGRPYMANLVPSCAKLPPTNSSEYSKCIRLDVKIPKPVFKLRLKNVTASIGDTVVLKCKIKSSKIVPTVTWYKDGKVIQPGHASYKIHLFRHSSRMKIRRLKIEDHGKYKCEVTNVAWTVSSESWITANVTGFHNATYPRCGVLKSSSVCARYLKNQSVYFENAEKEYNSEHLILRAIKKFHGSSLCSSFVMSAMCYHVFPSCVKGLQKQKLCKEDCLKVKNEFCHKMVPSTFPRCSKLPKRADEEGRFCENFEYAEKPSFKLKLMNITANVGETVILKCRIKHTKNTPKIAWYKDNKLISSNHPSYKIDLSRFGSRMEIKHLSIGDFGKYKCEITGGGWSVRSESWVTINMSEYDRNATSSRCGFLKPTSVCAGHLANKPVYFHDAQKQYNSERHIIDAIKKSHGSSLCSNYAISAMCYHLFPTCVDGVRKHRLCREDCRNVKNKICQKMVPPIFPQCLDLPKASDENGQYCEKSKSRPETSSRCDNYRGNNLCKKYLGNQTIYLYDAQRQYEIEKQLFFHLTKNIVSPNCFAFGIPAICYHLFPACDQGIRRSKLCKEECINLKTSVCKREVAAIDEMSPMYLSNMFPDCAMLPSYGSEDGKFCKQLQVPIVPTILATDVLYNTSHKCYNDTGTDYRGLHNISSRGSPCISWRIPRPNSPWSHNYCRNPNEEGLQPWCYVKKGKKEYCAVKRCEVISEADKRSGGDSTSLGRTIYVVIAIVAVILLGCITVIVYWKVQNSKENTDVSPASSAVPFAKSSLTQLNDDKENPEIKSFVMSEIMSRGKVKCVSRMWEGNFCKVFKGELVNDQGNSNMNIVIKALNNDANETGKEIFIKETNLLCHLQHINILGLLGISPTQDFVVFEYLSEINLHQFLQLKPPGNNINVADTPQVETLLSIATQIANGMKYLAEFNYIHGDVAARNCFISESGSCVKISMLGMGRFAYPSDYDCLDQDDALLPVRWMSPESIESLSLSSENDVWAFGVTLWEVFSFGQRPYHQHNNYEAAKKICARELLECAQEWPHCVRHLIKQCWTLPPLTRPNFNYIYEQLSNEYIILTDNTLEVRI